MTQSSTTAARQVAPDVVNNDLVPVPWKSLFENEEWLVHRIVVLSTYGMVAIVLVAHALVWFWRPWLQ
jgi:light-harvesting complex 1 beta chain